MGSPTFFPPTEIKRFAHRMPPYMPPYNSRRAASYNTHDPRGNMINEREIPGESSSQRKRIAVACGRCRKRKIRCSGDNGSGEPCTGCKNAGHEPCQYLRVSSQETPMKVENFAYGLDQSRQVQARGLSMVPSQLPSSMSPYADGMSSAVSEPLPYRNPSAYVYNNKHCYPVSAWTGPYSEDQGVDYGMYQPAYAPVQEPGYMVNSYRPTSNPAAAKSNGHLYAEPESGYGYSSAPNSTALAHRPATYPESGNLSLQSIATGMSHSIGSSDRVLPPVPPGRALPSSCLPAYRSDSLSSAYCKNSPSSPDGASPPSSLADVSGNYGSYDNSPLSSYPNTTLPSQLNRSNDIYTTSSSDSVADGSLRTPGSGFELTYRYTDTTTRRNSNSATSPGNLALANGGNSHYMSPSHSQHQHQHQHRHQHQHQPPHSPYMVTAGDIKVGSPAEAASPESHRKPTAALRA